MIDHKTQLNWVIGYPLEHTKSPTLHNAIYPLLNCNAVMLALSNKDLSSIIQSVKTASVGLVAVTMPFKEDILPYLDEMSVEVKKLKAANTIINRNGKLYGYNTDIDGVENALRNYSVSNKNVLIIGAGGAACAAAYYLQKNNANLLWLNRTPEYALSLIEIFGGSLVKDINNFPIDVIINTTPIGMFPNMNDLPLMDYQFGAHQIVFDMVYNPIDTMLLKKAKFDGAIAISGIDMFIGQGLKQIEIWLDKKIEISYSTIRTNLKKSFKK